MQGKKYNLNNLYAIFIIFALIFPLKSTANDSIASQLREKRMESQEMQERMETVSTYLSYLEKVSEHEKKLLREAIENKMAIYLARDSERALKNLSNKVFHNTMCLVDQIGAGAFVYINSIEQFVFKNEQEIEDYEKASSYMETLETPEYTQEEINKLCSES